MHSEYSNKHCFDIVFEAVSNKIKKTPYGSQWKVGILDRGNNVLYHRMSSCLVLEGMQDIGHIGLYYKLPGNIS